jgi:glycine C-acetyltransferase
MEDESTDAIDLGKLVREARQRTFKERIAHAGRPLDRLIGKPGSPYLRCLTSPNQREVEVLDQTTGKPRKMLMFACNSYLGLTNHPHVRERVLAAVRDYGVGIAGSAIVCGYSRLAAELEERLSAFKHAEASMIFPTGYQANVGVCTGLLNPNDLIIYDELSHTSLVDGIRMAGVKNKKFLHNDAADLQSVLEREAGKPGRDLFVGVEGVYSMDGDTAPLDRIAPACKQRGAILIVDDAHGTGVLGRTGAGTAEEYGVDVDVTVTTFSKAFGVVGAAVSASRDVVSCLRYFANSYVFSTALPPMVMAAVLGGLEVLAEEPQLRTQVLDNVKYTVAGLKKIGVEVHAPAAILAIRVPPEMNIRQAWRRFDDAGLFVGVVEYPAVALNAQRFRISLMSTHTRADLDRLLAVFEEIWEPYRSAPPV